MKLPPWDIASASMAGKKALTATSGPGISLYSDHISFAVGIPDTPPR
ncbi:hypothetical protein [Desulfobacter hydrogenophilus]|nr:hypothetical protein [Desulfobacter hydrogenophilus]